MRKIVQHRGQRRERFQVELRFWLRAAVTAGAEFFDERAHGLGKLTLQHGV
jgi:hypothetical protein